MVLLGKRCIERIENKFRLSAVVQYWLISTVFGFVLFPCHSPLIRKSSIPFRFESWDISPFLSCLTFCCKSNDSSRSLLPRKGLGMHSKLDLVRVLRTVLFLPSMRVFVSFDSTAESSDLFLSDIQLVVSKEEERKYFGKIDTQKDQNKSICHFVSLNNSRERVFKIKIQYLILDKIDTWNW